MNKTKYKIRIVLTKGMEGEEFTTIGMAENMIEAHKMVNEFLDSKDFKRTFGKSYYQISTMFKSGEVIDFGSHSYFLHLKVI